MTSKQRARLLKLADFLAGPVARAEKRTGRRKFDMEFFCSWNGEKGKEFKAGAVMAPQKVGLTKDLCNTAACALGWATVVFPRLLKLEGGDVVYKGNAKGYDGWGPPTDGAAATEVFGTTDEQNEKLWFSGWRRKPKDAAKVIRRIAREG